MTQSYVRVDDRNVEVEVTFYESVGKATRRAGHILIEDPTKEELAAAIKARLLAIRVERGRIGKLAND